MQPEEARAFAPGHVTGFFSVHRDGDPNEAGSRGAGVTLTDGVTATVRAADTRSVSLNDAPIEIEPVERVLDALEATVTVSLDTELPIGAGFGVSGAAALATALATADCAGLSFSENELITLAHGAEVRSDTGLGDVVAQARGGVPIRLDPGAPGYGRLDGVPAARRIEYVSLGDLSTAEVLTGDTDQLSAAGERALTRLRGEPTLEQFMHASRRFAREAGLLTDDVMAAIEDVSDAGGEASMAMLGETVFALDSGLTDAGYDATVTVIDHAGATLLGRDR